MLWSHFMDPDVTVLRSHLLWCHWMSPVKESLVVMSPHLPTTPSWAAGQLLTQHSAGKQNCWDFFYFTFCQPAKCLVFHPYFHPNPHLLLFCLTHACRSINCSTGLLQKESERRLRPSQNWLSAFSESFPPSDTFTFAGMMAPEYLVSTPERQDILLQWSFYIWSVKEGF